MRMAVEYPSIGLDNLVVRTQQSRLLPLESSKSLLDVEEVQNHVFLNLQFRARFVVLKSNSPSICSLLPFSLALHFS